MLVFHFIVVVIVLLSLLSSPLRVEGGLIKKIVREVTRPIKRVEGGLFKKIKKAGKKIVRETTRPIKQAKKFVSKREETTTSATSNALVLQEPHVDSFHEKYEVSGEQALEQKLSQLGVTDAQVLAKYIEIALYSQTTNVYFYIPEVTSDDNVASAKVMNLVSTKYGDKIHLDAKGAVVTLHFQATTTVSWRTTMRRFGNVQETTGNNQHGRGLTGEEIVMIQGRMLQAIKQSPGWNDFNKIDISQPITNVVYSE